MSFEGGGGDVIVLILSRDSVLRWRWEMILMLMRLEEVKFRESGVRLGKA